MSVPPAEASSFPEKSGTRWSGKTRGGHLGNWIFITLVRVFGVRCGYALLVPVSFYFLFFAPQALKASRDYRKRFLAFVGAPSWLAGMWGAYRHFFSFGQILLDRVAIIAQPPGRFTFEFEGEAHMREALAEGRGLLLASAHVGNWEIAGHLLRRLDVPVNIVAFKAEEDYARKHFARSAEGRVSMIVVDGTADVSLAILAALKRGEVVAMHADRNLAGRTGRTILLPFLGAPARFPVGPYVVAALSGAPLIHTFAMRRGLYHYALRAYPPEHLAFGARDTRESLLKDWALTFVERLQGMLRDYPLQWHNFYDFWEEETAAPDSSS